MVGTQTSCAGDERGKPGAARTQGRASAGGQRDGSTTEVGKPCSGADRGWSCTRWCPDRSPGTIGAAVSAGRQASASLLAVGARHAEDLGDLGTDRGGLVALREPLGDVLVVTLGRPVVHGLVVGGAGLDVLVAGRAGAGRDQLADDDVLLQTEEPIDRKSTRLNSSH